MRPDSVNYAEAAGGARLGEKENDGADGVYARRSQRRQTTPRFPVVGWIGIVYRGFQDIAYCHRPSPLTPGLVETFTPPRYSLSNDSVDYKIDNKNCCTELRLKLYIF